MTRMAVAGCMALAALSAVAVLDVGSPTAEAAPSVSPFAGSYVSDPLGAHGSWVVTTSDSGRITSSYSSSYNHRENGSISGRVSADGSYSFTMSETYAPDASEHGRTRYYTYRYESAGNMALDVARNIVGTEDTGRTFFWLRQ